MKTFTHVPPCAAALTVLLVLASCGGDAPPEDAGGEQAALTAAPEQPGTGELRVALEPLPQSVARGSLTLTAAGDSIVADVFADTNMGPGDYGVHIHEGTCEEGGRVAVALNSISGHESGDGESHTTFPASQLQPGGSYFVQLHSQAGVPIACGDLPPFNL